MENLKQYFSCVLPTGNRQLANVFKGAVCNFEFLAINNDSSFVILYVYPPLLGGHTQANVQRESALHMSALVPVFSFLKI